MAIYQFETRQLIPATMDEVWDFISSPHNLKEITPKDMDFSVVSQNIPEKMYPGMIIEYTVRPLLGIKTTWVTEITHVRDKAFFVDEQRVGPYKIWHHQHHIKPHEKGVEMWDIVTYQPPMGFLGAIANALVIKKKLKQIFAYRHLAVEERFGRL